MLKASLSELISSSISRIKEIFSNIQLEKISKPVALVGSGILFSILTLSPLALVGVLPDLCTDVFDLAIKKYTKKEGIPAKITSKTLKTLPSEQMRELLLKLQESMDNLMREDEKVRLQITQLIKESFRSEEFLDYLYEQQSLTVLIQENFKELLREFPDISEDVREIDDKIDSLMDQVRDIRKLLIDLRGDVQKIMAQKTRRSERRELKTKVAVTLGQMYTSSNLPDEMKLTYQTYYLKTIAKKMKHEEYRELMKKTEVWETEVADLTKRSPRLLDAKGSEFILSGDPLIIGRASGYEEVQFEDKFISRVHACIIYEWKSGQYYIRDLNSTNGTFLNGSRVQNSLLRNGDEIVIGRTSMSVEIDQKLSIVSTIGLVYALRDYLIVLGRSPSSKILVCKDPHVSRLHAIIIRDHRTNSYRIRDLNSTNKTFVNDKRLTGQLILRNGDVISMARTTDFTFESAYSQLEERKKFLTEKNV